MNRLRCALLALGVCCTVGCRHLEFRNTRVVDASYDSRRQATRVTLQFQVTDEDGRPLRGGHALRFSAFEDDREATSESLQSRTATAERIPAVLLIDTSKSMYDAPGSTTTRNAVMDVKAAAKSFLAQIEEAHPGIYEWHTYRFSNEVVKLASVDRIAEVFQDQQRSRWTALYFALFTALRRHPKAVIVLFSDGADNYSQNYGIENVDDLARLLREKKRVVHAVGFADVVSEKDRRGVLGSDALEQLTPFGSVHYADKVGSLSAAFEGIAEQILTTYTYEYYSPNLTDRHDIRLQATDGSRVGLSPVLTFHGGRELPAASSLPRRLPREIELPFLGCNRGDTEASILERFGKPSRVVDIENSPGCRHIYYDPLGLKFYVAAEKLYTAHFLPDNTDDA